MATISTTCSSLTPSGGRKSVFFITLGFFLNCFYSQICENHYELLKYVINLSSSQKFINEKLSKIGVKRISYFCVGRDRTYWLSISRNFIGTNLIEHEREKKEK
jgi:hypothetical protein